MTFEDTLAKAEAGDVEAMLVLANFYTAQSSKENKSSILLQEALPWYDRAAGCGHEFGKKMAAKLHFLRAYSLRQAVGTLHAKSTYEDETAEAIRLIQSMQQPDTDVLQEIREDMAIFAYKMSIELNETTSEGLYINKSIEYMLPYAKSYKRKEALEALVLALSTFRPDELQRKGYVDLFMRSAIACDKGQPETEFYQDCYAIIWSLAGIIHLTGTAPYPVDETAAYHCFEKACTYSDDYVPMLKKFKKKLFGGYVYMG